jgi:hypothetical protein
MFTVSATTLLFRDMTTDLFNLQCPSLSLCFSFGYGGRHGPHVIQQLGPGQPKSVSTSAPHLREGPLLCSPPYAASFSCVLYEAPSRSAPFVSGPSAPAASAAPQGSTEDTARASRRQSRAAPARACAPDSPPACSRGPARAASLRGQLGARARAGSGRTHPVAQLLALLVVRLPCDERSALVLGGHRQLLLFVRVLDHDRRDSCRNTPGQRHDASDASCGTHPVSL